MTPAPDPGKPQQQIRRERPRASPGDLTLRKVGITISPNKEMRELTSYFNHIYNEFPCSGLKQKIMKKFSHDLELATALK